MKKTKKYFGFITLVAITVLVLTGCASILYGVHIRTYGNLSSVVAGGTINFGSSGRSIKWAVSSNAAGTGAVAPGTNITQNGVLTVAANETASVLYVIATSTQDGFSDVKQIRIVTVSGVTITPTDQPVVVGRTLQFRAQVIGTNNPDNAVIWKVSSNTAGTGSVTAGTGIDANGLLTAAPNETSPALYIIATSVVDPSKFTTIPIGVVIPIVTGVAVTPPNQSITSGSTLQFNAAVTGTNNPDPTVTWRVSSNVAGNGAVTAGTNINANGLLTSAPNETSPVLYIFATSVANPAISGSAYVTVIIPIVTGVVVSPPTQSAAKGTTLQFVASVTGSNNPSNAVTWRVSSNASGTGAVTAGTNINANGLLTIASNETAQILYILATSVANPARFGNASVTVTASASAPTTKPAGTGGPVVNPAPTKPSATTPDTTAPAPTKPSVTTPDTTAPAATNPSVTTPGTTTPAATNPSVTTPVSTPTVTNVTVASSTLSTRTNTTVQLSSSVIGNNNPNTAVTWKVSSNAAGTGAVAPGTSISSNGLLTVAPNEWATALYVFATSVADPTKSGSATVTIINNTETQGPNQGQAQPKQ